MIKEEIIMESEFQQNSVEEVKSQKKGFGITGIILGGFSILCCSCFGIGVLISVVGIIFSIIAAAKGTGSAKTLGIVGIILNGIGLLLGAYMLLSYAMMLNWDNITIENLNKINNIDPNDQNAIREWMQQFFKVDISGYSM